MAMLAEPRRRQKWSLDPRNSAWSKDESKFGQKMLEKMGWSKGKGLGAQEQGSTEHIKVHVKNNTLGLGTVINHEDNWIAHQDDFNQLLADLNNCYGQGKADSSENQQKKTFSLEEKSKSSRKRVHYMKFAKGKDLSSRSETDLACIFGKRQKNKKKTHEEEASVDSIEETESETRNAPGNAEQVISGPTVTSALTVKEYFAKRMAVLKSQDKTKVKDRETNLAGTSLEEAEENSSASEELKYRSKKKKRSKGKVDCDMLRVKHSMKYRSESKHKLEESHLECQTGKKKKKSKDKHKTRERDSEGSTGSFMEDLMTHVEASEEKAFHKNVSGVNKKKKKRNKEATECDKDRGDGYCPSVEGSKRKKRKKRHAN